ENTFTGAEGAFERTTNGALHGVVSRTSQGGHRAGIYGADAIRDYLANNPGREVAMFVWADVTRVATATTNLYFTGMGNTAAFATNRLLLGSLNNTTGPRQKALNSSGWSGSPNANASLNAIYQAFWGNVPPYNSLRSDDGQSFILYQYHLIDVAASGMSYAELLAADQAAYTAFFGEGGRGFGDATALDLGSYP
ncbi:hypothetical protein, partial [Pacificoceanicola onchidii]|uniref:hypothetical protein n=1 Tax=Pacificoceanicola onchidii TaxID=2562685 RepID=UPI001455E893